ncbi:hypothetical protein MNBD_GAMMA07-272 [hydrothermal vent metagenome]|uniref:Uncharacterized protein n=1 Tax=hydrothermal vent metagenome TaxID=652676 RepID=A0A3B0WP36_9ZZZZ
MSIEMLFSKTAGRRERMLKRQYNNPLFGKVEIEPFDIQDARKQDASDVEAFISQFRNLVVEVTELDPSADVELILKMKETLDKTYEDSAGLAGDQSEIQDMIKRLLNMMMQSMWKAVGNDAMGISKLEMEEQARVAHFTLLEHPFIADLLSPNNYINETLLVPCLLSEKSAAVMLAVQLFDPEQQQMVFQQGVELLKALDENDPHVCQANQRLQDIASVITAANQQPS